MGPAALPIMAAGTMMQAVGGMNAAAQQQAQGAALWQGAQYTAAQQVAAGQQAFAEGTGEAANQAFLNKTEMSNAIGRAGFSGAETTSPSVVANTQLMAGRNYLKTLGDVYTGEARQAGLQNAAYATLYQGQQADLGAQSKAQGMRYQALGTMMSSAGGIYEKFGAGGPPSTSVAGTDIAGTSANPYANYGIWTGN